MTGVPDLSSACPTLPSIDNFDTIIVRLSFRGRQEGRISGLFFLVCVLLSCRGVKTMVAKKIDIPSPALRRKSMELLKNITQMLQEILSSGDEEGFRRLEETIRVLERARHKPGGHAVH